MVIVTTGKLFLKLIEYLYIFFSIKWQNKTFLAVTLGKSWIWEFFPADSFQHFEKKLFSKQTVFINAKYNLPYVYYNRCASLYLQNSYLYMTVAWF